MKPREKLIRYGVTSLTDVELLALLLRTGSVNNDVCSLSSEVIKKFGGLKQLVNADFDTLCKIRGIKNAKATSIIALSEMIKRVLRPEKNEFVFSKAFDIYRWLQIEVGVTKQEQFLVVYLNNQNCLISWKILFIGTLDKTLAHPREIIKEALIKNASSIICVHNHPGGSLTPSEADIQITIALIEAVTLVGISILDHIIVSENGYVSLRDTKEYLFRE